MVRNANIPEKRLTHKRNNGIKDGYWSPNKIEELVARLAQYEEARLAQYEDTGLDPEKIIQNRAEPKKIATSKSDA